ncbi:DEAD/DEAH box helicase [Butyrivibrio sp. FCS014]|uniref:DEAD/DEAH box helicase n=1 Tax=Butyrivibrio sp. FCS014 TaxID=1408304 RepID=UPI0004B90951|nr:SNF2-related protein [Butyrivibrio sp. FCS014]
MKKPDFKELKKLIRAISDADAACKNMYAEGDLQREQIRQLCGQIAARQAKDKLDGYSVEELKKSKAGIRVSALISAGYNTLGDIAAASDGEIRSIEGIGDKQIEAIRRIVTEFANSLSQGETVKLQREDTGLITALFRYMKCEKVRKDAGVASKGLSEQATRIAGDPFIRNGVHWLFSGSELKQHTLEMADFIYTFTESEFFGNVLGFFDLYQEGKTCSSDEAIRAFEKNGADFYALLESLGSIKGNRPFVYDSIPMMLAEEIDGLDLDLSGFTGNLRAYQVFGAKYILNQKDVLLGDEMGLGKTVQAIAAMAHISARAEGICHFLVVCPASVLVNWGREIEKFSNIRTFTLHGAGIEDSFDRWKQQGGAAITNYESMGKIVDGIDNRMKLNMLIIDEAHYIKNPDAQRTRYIRRLDNESERILLMTGTPLENRVEEMCNLLDFVRPDMTSQIRSVAHISNLPEFKQKLAPVYLRRTRSQVLTELPPISEKEEWCSMTADDTAAYIAAIGTKSFQTMRRVSFLQEDLTESAKGRRLLELCDEAVAEGRKAVVYSFYRETIARVHKLLGKRCSGVISGDVAAEERQGIIDAFSDAKEGSVLLCQVQAGGVGLNIQAASMVIFCEPQIKPSLTWQALSRVYRMGQVRNVTVYHLLCPDTIDEDMILRLEEKQISFDSFANESVVAGAYDDIMDREWINDLIKKQNEKYLPTVL